MAYIIDTAKTTYPIPRPKLSTPYEIPERAYEVCYPMLIVQKLESQSIDFEENSVVERIFRVLNQNHLRPIKRKKEDYSELKVQSEIDNEHGPVTDGDSTCLVSSENQSQVIVDSSNTMTYREVCLAIEKVLKNEELMEKYMMSPGLKGKTFIIQGFKKLGTALATFLVQNGALCIGIKDEDAQIYNPEGLDVKKLYENKLYDGTIKFYPGAILDSSDIIYKEKSDILIFSADHKSLNWYTPEDIRARIIIEATDNATMPRAPIISKEKSQLVVPDIYACPGANVDSYVEFLWNLQQLGKLDNKMLRISLGVNKTGVEQYQLEEEAQLPVQTGSPLSAIVNLSIVNRAAILDTLEYILAEKKIFNYTDLFTIGTDIRAAALIIGINNIFKSLYQHKRFF